MDTAAGFPFGGEFRTGRTIARPDCSCPVIQQSAHSRGITADMMDENRLIEIAASLEDLSADAKTRLQRCKPPHCVALTANREGFLRLAVSCLRAAAAPIPENDCRSAPLELTEPPHHQVADDDSDCIIAFLQRMETWPEPMELMEARDKRARQNDRWALVTCGVVGFVILLVLIAGFAAILGWVRSAS